MSFAVIKTGGKQYIVEAGQKLRIEKLVQAVGDTISFDDVLLFVDDATVKVGTPHVAGAKVTAKVLAQDKAKKIRVVKYHEKSRYKKTYGHRQPYTQIEITQIETA